MNGNVGIGTTAPVAALHVSGNTVFSGEASYLSSANLGTFQYALASRSYVDNYDFSDVPSGHLSFLDSDYPGGLTWGAWSDGNFVYAANHDGGLYVYSIDKDGVLTSLDSDDPGGYARKIWGDGKFIYLANHSGGLYVYSVDSSGNLTELSSDTGCNAAADVWSDGNFIYGACGAGDLRVYTVDASGTLTRVSTVTLSESVNGVWGDGQFIYVANGSTGLSTYSVDLGGTLTPIDNDTTVANAFSVWGDERFIYVTDYDTAILHTYSVDTSGNLTNLDSYSLGSGRGHDVWSDGRLVYLAADVSDLWVFAVDDDGNLNYVDYISGNNTRGVWGDDQFIYMADWASGLRVFSVGNAYEYDEYNQRHLFSTSGSERLRINSNGYIGVGTTNPGTVFHVARSNNTAALWLERVDTSVEATNVVGALKIYGGEDGRAEVGSLYTIAESNWTSSSSPTYLSFKNTASGETTALERMRITSTGNVGVGTTTPTGILDISSQAGVHELIFTGSGINANVSAQTGAELFIGTLDAQDFSLVTGGATARRMTITSGGNVGIGTTAPREALEINGNLSLASGGDIKINTSTLLTVDGTENTLLGILSSTGSGDYNTHVGYATGRENNTGSYNAVFGTRAADRGVQADYNVVIGYNAGFYPITGDNNINIGYQAGYQGASGANNTFIGGGSGYNISSGASNTYVGYGSGNRVTEGIINSGFGLGAGYWNQEGDGNLFLGYQAGYGTSGYDASNNVIVGNQAGYNITDGSSANVFLGYQAGYNETGANKLYIENSNANSASALVYGDFSSDVLTVNGNLGIGTTNPGAILAAVSSAPDVNGLLVKKPSLAQNLIAFWQMDETSGTRYDAVDTGCGGSGCDLSDYNTVTQAEGKIDNAGQFTYDNSEYLARGDHASLSTGDIDFTFSAWVYLDSTSSGTSDRSILIKSVSPSGTKDREFDLAVHNGFGNSIRFSVGNGSTSGGISGLVPTTDTWYHIVAWHDSVNNEIGLAVNGSASTTPYADGGYDNSGDFMIGGRTFSGGDYMDGRIDSVGFWKRVLTAEERAALYNGGDGAELPGANLAEFQDESGSVLAYIDDEGGAVFNEQGYDSDFRIEGDSDTHLLFIDAGLDAVGLGYTNLMGTTGKLLVNGNVGIGTSTPGSALDLAGGSLTLANDEVIGNATNDIITFTGAGGSDDTDFYLNLDGKYPTLYSNTNDSLYIADRLVSSGFLESAESVPTTMTDSSGNGYTGTPSANATWTNAGYFGKASIFDGTGDLITVSGEESMGTQFTVEAWLYRAGGSTDPHIAAHNDSGTIRWQLRTDGSHGLTFQVDCSTDANYRAGWDEFTTGVWHHVAVTFDTSTGIADIWVDGSEVSYVTQTQGVGCSAKDTPTHIGGYSGFVNNTFNGSIDELRISNTLRYTTGFSVPTAPFENDANTLLLYHFDKGSRFNHDLYVFGDISTDGDLILKDDKGIYFGRDSNYLLSYDETTNNALELTDGSNNFLQVFDQGSAADFSFNGDSVWFDNGGNVGIGTTNPDSVLHLVKDQGSTIARFDSYHSTGLGYSGAFQGRRARGTADSPAAVQDGDYLFNLDARGYDGGDFNAFGAVMRITVDGAVTTNQVPTKIALWTNEADATRHEALVIRSTGNVGIGTANPSGKLEVYTTENSGIRVASGATGTNPFVSGSIAQLRSTTATGYLILGAATNDTFYMQATKAGTVDGTLALNPNGGNVGIGTTAPTEKLEVNGRISMATWTADGDTAVFKNDTSGDIGITSSDVRLKKNLNPLVNGLDIINSLDTYLYNPIYEEDGTKQRLGVLAQDLLPILPEATFNIYQDEDGDGSIDGEYYGVHYEKLGVLALQGIKEQQEQIDSLSTEGIERSVLGIQDSMEDIQVRLDALEALEDMSEASESTQTPIEEPSEILATILEVFDEFKEFVEALGLSKDGDTLQVSSAMAVIGDTTLNNVTITGDITAGLIKVDTLENSLGITGADCGNNQELCGMQTLYLQKDLTGNVDVLAGVLTIEPNGDVTIRGTLEAQEVVAGKVLADEVVVGNPNIVGRGVLPAGEISLEVESTLVVEDSFVFVTPTKKTQNMVLVVTETVENEYFKVEIEDPIDEDIEFNWWILNSR